MPTIIPASGNEIKQSVCDMVELRILMFVCFQYAVRQIPVSDQLDRAGIFLAQPFFRNVYTGVIMQSLVHAGNIFHHGQDRADIVRDQNNGTLFIDILQ